MPKTVYALPADVVIKKTIAVMSSKGGVGKSTVTSLLASQFAKLGLKVGILDADIIGPTISEAFGITEKIVEADGKLQPGLSSLGIKIVSSQMLLEKTSDPILWRAPLVVDLIRQFYVDIAWGQLDILFIDMPPGTGDVSLTVLESLHVEGIVMVTSPQDIVTNLVQKGVNMARKINIPIVGVIENYSYFVCDQCDKKHYFFGSEHTKKLLHIDQLTLLGSLPIDSTIATAMDHGKIETIVNQTIEDIVKEMIGYIHGKK